MFSFAKIFFGIASIILIILVFETSKDNISYDVDIALDSQKKDLVLGEEVRMDVAAEVKDESINAVELKIKFPPDKLEVLKIEREEKAIDLWVKEPFFSNSEGFIEAAGGSIKGFKGRRNIFSVIFKPKATGEATILVEHSLVFFADGNGREARSSRSQLSYNIIDPARLSERSTEESKRRGQGGGEAVITANDREENKIAVLPNEEKVSPAQTPFWRMDFNGDNKINFIDTILFLIAYTTRSKDSKYDLNGDGRVTLGDFSIYLSGF
jgi:hypothetical protein